MRAAYGKPQEVGPWVWDCTKAQGSPEKKKRGEMSKMTPRGWWTCTDAGPGHHTEVPLCIMVEIL